MLIHCTEGAHRGPFASAVWLMAKTGRTMHEVVKYLEQLRCLVHLRPDVKDLLRSHERELSNLFRDLRAGQIYHGGPWATQPLPAIKTSDELLRHLDRDKKQHKEPDKEPDNKPDKEHKHHKDPEKKVQGQVKKGGGLWPSTPVFGLWPGTPGPGLRPGITGRTSCAISGLWPGTPGKTSSAISGLWPGTR